MLNNVCKKQAIRDLQKVDEEYSKVLKKSVQDMEQLQHSRTMAVRVILCVEEYIMGIANKPRNFETKMGEVKIRYTKFQEACQEIQEIERIQAKIGKTGGVGIAGALSGIGIASLGPTAAMSVAMTFGTASTGTAIASLSGAAATNAALAWLGGGALAAGGAGMAAGQTILTLAGPIGWAIGGVSLAGSLVAINISNKEIAKKTEKSISIIKTEIERIDEIDVQVLSWDEETKALSNAVMDQLNKLERNRKLDYKRFDASEMEELTILMNLTEVLSKMIGKTIKGEN